MRKMVDKLLRQYGTEVMLLRGEEAVTLRCFFQPVNSTSWQSIEKEARPLGQSSRAEYTCVSPAQTRVEAGDVLRAGEGEYLVRRAEAYYYRGQVVCRWALCVEKGRDDTWGM